MHQPISNKIRKYCINIIEYLQLHMHTKSTPPVVSFTVSATATTLSLIHVATLTTPDSIHVCMCIIGASR